LRIEHITTAVLLIALVSPPAHCQTDWPMYGHDDSSNRYSPLTQINTGNVAGLTRVWTYHMATAAPANTTERTTCECEPAWFCLKKCNPGQRTGTT